VQLFKRLFGGRQKEGSTLQDEALTSRISQFSLLLEPKLLPKASMIETIKKADENGLSLLSNREMDRMLVNGGLPVKAFGKIRTGTLLIFEECGRPFKDKVEYFIGLVDHDTLLFEVPKQYQGKTGCFVCEHPYFRLSEISQRKFRVDIPMSKLHHMARYSGKEGLFEIDGFFRIPVGERIKPNGEKKDLRFHSVRPSSFIGLLARDVDDPRRLHTTETADEEMQSLVRVSINPGNYVSQVVSMMKNGANEKMRGFVLDWAKEDKRLAKAILGAGIVS
jgi:hypothetical protein